MDCRIKVAIYPHEGIKIAKYLNISVNQFYNDYTVAITEPVITVGLKNNNNLCVFNIDNKCILNEAKPRCCKVYPELIQVDYNAGMVYSKGTVKASQPLLLYSKIVGNIYENFNIDDEMERYLLHILYLDYNTDDNADMQVIKRLHKIKEIIK